MWGLALARPCSRGTLTALSRTLRRFQHADTTSDDLCALARDVALKELLPHSLAWDRDKTFPVDKLRVLGSVGFGACFVSPEFDGLALTRRDAARIFMQLAYGDVPVAAYISIHNMVARVLNEHAQEAAKDQYLSRIASMDLLCSYCLTEPGSGSDAAAMSATARQDGSDYVLTGTKAFISGGGAADLYLVMARTGTTGTSTDVSAFLVERGAAGVSFGAPEDKMGWRCQPTCSVTLDGVRVPAQHVVGKIGQGFKIAMQALDGGRINIGACSVGGAHAALDRTKAYCSERQQFGKAIDSFQVTRHKLADCVTRLVVSETMVLEAARALDERDRGDALNAMTATVAAAMAKRVATDECLRVVDDCLQLHGGYGYLCDYGIEQRYRDLRVHTILEGTNEIMREVIWKNWDAPRSRGG